MNHFTYIKSRCSVCGNDYDPAESGSHAFCSKECKEEWEKGEIEEE